MIDIKKHIRTVPDFPIKGIQFRDITSLLENTKAFNKTLIEMTAYCMMFNANKMIGIESRGFLFGSPIARDMEIPFYLARKPGKLPNETVSRSYELEYGEAELHIQKISKLTEYDKIVIIDDLIATGGTALACANLVSEKFYVPKENIMVLAVIDLPDLGGSKLIESSGYKVETLVEFEGE
jgi:adenine phosphoribosyltransferase